MKQIVIQDQLVDAAPRTTEESLYPNIDDTYTVRTYTGERLIIRDNQVYGIKLWGAGMPSGMQGMAIYNDILVRTKNSTTGHKIYQIGPTGVLTELATFDLDLGHANSCQFDSVIYDGQTFPYLYVAALSGICYVLSISSTYEVSIVQTITIENTGQVLKGDDGYMWASSYTTARNRWFGKYRKVLVSEGETVNLTSEDLLESFDSVDVHPASSYTAQGWKIKLGKIWFNYGVSGSSEKRGAKVYETATHRLIATIDLSDYTNAELEDVELYDNGLIIATVASFTYMLKF